MSLEVIRRTEVYLALWGSWSRFCLVSSAARVDMGMDGITIHIR